MQWLAIEGGRSSMYKFIMISGKAGSGKDTVADILKSKYGFRDYRYADSLKDILYYAGWDGKKDLRGRKLLQDVGKAFRKWDVNFWVDKLLNKIIEDIAQGYTRFTIADVRHENELYYFIEQIQKIKPKSKFIHIRIIGRTDVIEPREMDEETLNDISETGVDHITPDYYIYNTIKDNYKYLEEQLDTLIKNVFGE